MVVRDVARVASREQRIYGKLRTARGLFIARRIQCTSLCARACAHCALST